ncbi:hypothetical protein DAI22_08g050550 [Oryza sativa Japonica Group]|nr:hypothetical protein DAI22_08g050550 [Oryza sativa Japonica Group]
MNELSFEVDPSKCLTDQVMAKSSSAAAAATLTRSGHGQVSLGACNNCSMDLVDCSNISWSMVAASLEITLAPMELATHKPQAW